MQLDSPYRHLVVLSFTSCTITVELLLGIEGHGVLPVQLGKLASLVVWEGGPADAVVRVLVAEEVVGEVPLRHAQPLHTSSRDSHTVKHGTMRVIAGV